MPTPPLNNHCSMLAGSDSSVTSLQAWQKVHNSNFVELLLEFMLHLMLIYSERKK